MASGPQARVITYIDGFNLYFGLKEAKYRRFYWLDVLIACCPRNYWSYDRL